jgi:hypothetical protein
VKDHKRFHLFAAALFAFAIHHRRIAGQTKQMAEVPDVVDLMNVKFAIQNDMIKNNEIALIINTVEEKRQAISDSRSIRVSGLQARVTMYTTLWGAEAAAEGITSGGELEVYSVQGLHGVLT